MANAKFTVPFPTNEPVKSYAPGTQERNSLKAKLKEMKGNQVEIPLIIGGDEVKTGKMGDCVLPHDHETVIGKYHQAGEREVKAAIDTSLEASKQWAMMDWQDRAAVFLKAADLLSGSWRALLNARNTASSFSSALSSSSIK